MLQIVRTIFIIFPRPVSTAEDNHTCIQLHHTRRQRTAGIRSCFIGDYIPITLRNRWTEITSLAGKSHRPIHLPIRTPSTREPDGFTSLFLYVRTHEPAQCMIWTFRNLLRDPHSRCPPPTSLYVPLHSPRYRSAGHTTLLSIGPRAFQGMSARNNANPGAGPTGVMLLLRCIFECSTKRLALSRDVSNWLVSPLTR